MPPDIGSGGTIVEIFFDIGKELSHDEFMDLGEKVELIKDENGKKYQPFMSRIIRDKKVTISNKQGTVILEWNPVFAYSYLFEVNSETLNYTLNYKDYPPLDIGNPFESPFLLENE